MVRILNLNNPRLAQAFVDYMATQGFTLTMKHESQEVQLWLEDESRLEEAEKQVALFVRDPLHPRYQEASWKTGKAQPHLKMSHTPFLKTLRSRAGPLTIGMIVLSLAVFILQQMVGDELVMSWLAWPDSSRVFQLWRWFTPALMNFSFIALLINLAWWWYLASQIEMHLGSGKLFTVTLISALISGWGQSMVNGSWFGGLSGVVYALMGYAWLTGQLKPESRLYVPGGLLVISLIFMFIGYATGGAAVSNAAHAFGLGLGLIMAFVDTRTPRNKKNK
ncbi:rhomboid family intramembrane serine protease GlpG [Rahnella aceris]|jgi:GlpG protein|uniref:rhomboid family intramembrane serine protease GlpG n=1 Tax=Rahnella sp. (strain Y9602) TaxID=2703885 RepID=UPI001C2712AB|nr:rhomboid family intramembrane serine protease GlpG [Rahnella aceris]MBU9842461.1 rhomboid family intramembrane serine protease GlpG [Rahnella aceris]